MDCINRENRAPPSLQAGGAQKENGGRKFREKESIRFPEGSVKRLCLERGQDTWKSDSEKARGHSGNS